MIWTFGPITGYYGWLVSETEKKNNVTNQIEPQQHTGGEQIL